MSEHVIEDILIKFVTVRRYASLIEATARLRKESRWQDVVGATNKSGDEEHAA